MALNISLSLSPFFHQLRRAAGGYPACITTRPPFSTSTYRLCLSSNSHARESGCYANVAPVSAYLGWPSQSTVTLYTLTDGNSGVKHKIK